MKPHLPDRVSLNVRDHELNLGRILMLSLQRLFFLRIKGGKGANGLSPIATFFPQGILHLALVPLANKEETHLAL